MFLFDCNLLALFFISSYLSCSSIFFTIWDKTHEWEAKCSILVIFFPNTLHNNKERNTGKNKAKKKPAPEAHNHNHNKQTVAYAKKIQNKTPIHIISSAQGIVVWYQLHL